MRRPRKNAALLALVLVNAALLTVLTLRHLPENKAMAQPAPGRFGDYICVPATISGAPNGLIFVLDQANNQLGGLAYDASSGTLQNIPRIDLGNIFNAATTPVAPNPTVTPKRGLGGSVVPGGNGAGSR